MAHAPSPPSCVFCRRQGIALIYVCLILVILVGFVSLAVDLGRVRLAGTELQVAADASARAAVSCIRTDVAEAETRAIHYAAANKCASTPVALDAAQDLSFGRWNYTARSFTVLTGEERSKANAARAAPKRLASRDTAVPLFFGPAVGQENVDLSAEAIATVRGGSYRMGIVGIDWIRMNGTSETDSYDSRVAPYDPGNPGEHGDISTNGYIDLIGTPEVNGNAFYGPDPPGDSITGEDHVTGLVEPLPEDMVFPEVDASPYRTNNNNASIGSSFWDKNDPLSIRVNNGATLTLNAGIYYVRDFTVTSKATLAINGDVTLYVTGSMKIEGAVSTLANTAGNFKIRVDGPGEVDWGGNSNLYADVYAPESNVKIHGTADFYGAVVGRTLWLPGTSDIHYDEALGRLVELPLRIALVK